MKFKWSSSTLLLLVPIIFAATLAQNEVNDKCTVRYNGKPGICKLDTDCPSALKKNRQGIRPTYCGFSGNRAVLCCENSKAKEQCAEYSKDLTKKVVAISLLPISTPIEIDVTRCDYNSVPLIVGGQKAIYGEFPHMVALGTASNNGDYRYVCGGTIISEIFILTAAHCLTSARITTVRVGDLDLEKSGDTEGNEPYNINVERYFVHPEYKPPAKYNDIGLLKVRENIKFHKNVRPACLWTEPNFKRNKTIATGWGAIQHNGGGTSELRKVQLNIFPNSRCENDKEYQKMTKTRKLFRGIIDSQMCVGDLDESKDTCQGDSGGPIVISDVKNSCLFNVIGITSFGKGCGSKVPAIYSRVSSFVPWIESIVWP